MGFNSSPHVAAPRQQRGDYTAKARPIQRMIYYTQLMQKFIRPAIILALSIFLALSCAMIAFSTKPPITRDATNAALLMQITPTPRVAEDRSEVGSTDGIAIMGGVIAVIVLLPLLLQRKAWAKENQT